MSTNHKVGSSFSRLLTIPPEYADGYFSGWVATASVKSLAGTPIDTMTCEWLNPATTRVLSVKKIDTSTWPVGVAEIDVRFRRTADGETIITTTAQFVVVPAITTA